MRDARPGVNAPGEGVGAGVVEPRRDLIENEQVRLTIERPCQRALPLPPGEPLPLRAEAGIEPEDIGAARPEARNSDDAIERGILRVRIKVGNIVPQGRGKKRVPLKHDPRRRRVGARAGK